MSAIDKSSTKGANLQENRDLDGKGIHGAENSKCLQEIVKDVWQRRLERDTNIRVLKGFKVLDLPEVTFEQAQSEAEFSQSALDRLSRVQEKELDTEEQLSLRILKWDLELVVESLKYFWLKFPVTPYTTPLGPARMAFTTYNFSGPGDLDDYLALLEKTPALIDSIGTRLVEQRDRGILLPRDSVDLVTAFLKKFIQEPKESLFWVDDTRLARLDPRGTDKFQHDVARFITQEINPAFDRLISVFSAEYHRDSPAQIGLCQYPGGKDYYRLQVMVNTTLDVSPEEVHSLGLNEVERLNEEMFKLRESIGFKGTKEEFHEFIRTDSRFFVKTVNELAGHFIKCLGEIEPKLDLYFSQKPKAPYAVKRLDPRLEGSMTFGYYQEPTPPTDPNGYYYFSGHDLDRKPFLLDARGLIYHELVPGHHFQVCLQMENEMLPDFRRIPSHNAYLEGWAEYAAKLTVEMGLYNDPYEQYGILMRDLFFSVRLVVDTGMNYFGWSRDRAAAFIRENSIEPDSFIRTETLRYAVDMPGQALAYKMGSHKFYELRKRFLAWGKENDDKKFHALVLGSGCMPLSILEWYVNKFI